jgi:hypothetical protein
MLVTYAREGANIYLKEPERAPYTTDQKIQCKIVTDDSQVDTLRRQGVDKLLRKRSSFSNVVGTTIRNSQSLVD